MNNWKKYVKIARKHKAYNIAEDKRQERERRKKSKKFYKKWGFRFEEIWSLDKTIATFILPRLAFYRDNQTGYPSHFVKEFNDNGNPANDDGAAEWKEEIDKMVEAFRLILETESFERTNEEREIVKEGLRSFAENFESLWD